MLDESPLIQELVARTMQETRREDILGALTSRFGSVPADLAAAVRAIVDDQRLRDLHSLAAVCPDLKTFRAQLQP